MATKWIDATSYDRSERGVIEPRTWEATFGAVRIIVTRKHGLGDLWFMQTRGPLSANCQLKSTSAVAAKAEALSSVRNLATAIVKWLEVDA